LYFLLSYFLYISKILHIIAYYRRVRNIKI